MGVGADLLDRKATHFVLWRPRPVGTAPALVIGEFQPGNPPSVVNQRRVVMTLAPGVTGLWQIAAADCGLRDGRTYHYWFEVDDTVPHRSPPGRILCTDPTAFAVDWRLLADRLPPPYTDDDRLPASVIHFENGRLGAADPGGERPDFTGDVPPDRLPVNSRLVIYELPTAWSRRVVPESLGLGVGTFRDVIAMVDASREGANFSDLGFLAAGRAYLAELGVNAIELLPPADSFFKREWGYDTAHFFAPDFELGFPEFFSSPTALSDLADLVKTCHRHGIRFFVDVVMAFARNESYQHIDFDDFYIDDPARHPGDPDALTSGRGDGHQDVRNAFGSTLFRYTRGSTSRVYDPISGGDVALVPARQLMYTYLTHWMNAFRVDGIRMDSVENVANWDFVRDFKNRARALFQNRWDSQGLGPGAEERFLVVGEELTLPMGLLGQQRLDGLWNDRFRELVRAAILGEPAAAESFESAVRQAIDCRALGFADGAQAINYLTSHDVEGFRRERLYTMLTRSQVSEVGKRIRLGFVCLLTAVGIPMILAGEEFGDQHDRFDEHGNVSQDGGKQVDPVNFTRLQDPARKAIFDYVARLVRFRTVHPALAVNDTAFLHTDFHDGKRVLVWKRGGSEDDPVIVVANFSDFASAGGVNGEYRVPNWPATPADRRWREVTQDRLVAPDEVGREPIFSWEAKVYTLE